MNKCLLFTVSMLCTGCSLRTPYDTPEIAVPVEWKNDRNTVDVEPLCNWWELFHDPVLDDLENRALAANPNLKVAIAHVEEAWAETQRVRSALYPFVTFTPFESQIGTSNPLSGFTNSATSASSANANALATAASAISPLSRSSATSAAANASAAPLPMATPAQERFHLRIYELPVNISYDFDLWGKQLNSWQSQIALAESEEEQFRLTQLNITTQVATAYYQLRSLDAQEAILTSVVGAYHHALEVNQKRYESGLVNYLDVTRAALQLSNAEANLAITRGRRALSEDLLATLIGTSASLFTIDAEPLSALPPMPPSSIPSSVLRQRPDLASMERHLFAAHLQIAVAKADFFPDLQISATFGTASALLKNLLDWRARLWSYTLQMMQVVFDAGRTEAGVERAKAVYLQRLGSFEAQVLQVFQAVEDALATIHASEQQYRYLQESLKVAKESLRLTEDRYSRGLINSLDVIIAHNDLLTAQIAVTQALEQWYLAIVNLLNALGGEWSEPPNS